jgi:UDP-3-O-[3-hydroxymyristoyl] glucosamine N-acyltransferase LpxD
MIATTAREIVDFCSSLFPTEARIDFADFEINSVTTSDKMCVAGLAFSKAVVSGDAGGTQIPDGALMLAPPGSNSQTGLVVIVNEPRLAFAKVLAKFFAQDVAPGIHATAIVDLSAQVSPTATIGAYCFVGPNCKISDRAVLHQHVILSRNVSIGPNSVIFSNCVIGEDGYGFEEDQDGNLFPIPHIGGVDIGANVRIGSLNSIASGTINPTTIGEHTKTDNLVHIAHNVKIGRNCRITACAEISGSVTIGDRVWLSPNVSIINKIAIGDGAFVGMGAAVTKSVAAHTVVAGVPAKLIKVLEGGSDDRG